MLNAERVILMTRLASYENGEGKKNVAIGKYFRSDYIRMQTIKSIIYATITFCIFVGLAGLMDLEAFMGDIYQMDLIDYGKTILYWYLAFVGVYGLISFIVYSVRYKNARKQLKLYFNNLKNLSELYDNTEPKGKSNE